MKYRKKAVVIDAIRWNGDNQPEIETFVGHELLQPFPGSLVIPTLEGDHLASRGDWIIRGVKGEHYPCKPDIFAMTYEPADAGEEG